MLKLLKSKRALLITAIVAVLGWAGVRVAEKDVASIVNLALQDGETAGEPQQLHPQQPHPQKTNTTSQATSDDSSVTDSFNKASRISPQRREHILYGDATGGGHKHGANKPCKSEFPAHWDDDTIIKEVEMIAANDNLNWEEQRNGYYVTEQKVGTVKVRVVKARNGNDVITAYPTNVKRNPCPPKEYNGTANDN